MLERMARRYVAYRGHVPSLDMSDYYQTGHLSLLEFRKENGIDELPSDIAYRVARKAMLDILADEKKLTPHLPRLELAGTLNHQLILSMYVDVKDALAKLPASRAVVYRCLYWYGYTKLDLAEIQDTTIARFRASLNHSLGVLRTLLEPYDLPGTQVRSGVSSRLDSRKFRAAHTQTKRRKG